MSRRRPEVLWMAIVCAVMAATLVSAHEDTTPKESYVLLVAPPASDFRAWREQVSACGIELRHAFPPAGGVAVFGEVPSTAELATRVPPGTLAYAESPGGKDAERLQANQEGRLLWHAHRALTGIEGPQTLGELPHGRPLFNDALEPIRPLPEGTCVPSTLALSTSEYLLGSVTVNVILPESTGVSSTENWTETMETNVSNGIVQGLNDLSITYYNRIAALRPTWVIKYIFGQNGLARPDHIRAHQQRPPDHLSGKYNAADAPKPPLAHGDLR